MKRPFNIGLSVGTIDTDFGFLFDDLYNQKKIDYVELYFREETRVDQLAFWNFFDFPVVLHAPHGKRARFKESYVDLTLFGSEILRNFHYVIFNAGLKGDGDIWQYQKLDAFPEIMPKFTNLGDISQFTLPEEVKGKFCLDFSHVWLTEQQMGLKNHELTLEFLKQKPAHFHLANTRNMVSDDYVRFNKGLIDKNWIINNIPKNANVTIEVDETLKNRRQEIIDSLEALHKLI